MEEGKNEYLEDNWTTANQYLYGISPPEKILPKCSLETTRPFSGVVGIE